MADRALLTKKLGRYDILRVLGKGAMGVVYEARDPNLNRRVAIKVIGVDTLSPEEAADYEQRFRTEAHSAARLQHPNIVSVYDSDRDDDTPYMVMEYVDGKDLKRHLDDGQRYTLEQSVRMMCDLLSALEYAHQHKIVHRDIKPANMLIEASGRLKLTDFGVARIQDSGDGTRTQGGMVGTLKYMSPEQVDGKPVDAASDMFSAGIVLYQLLTDRRPFDGNSYFAIATQITHQDPPAPSTVNVMLPVELDAVVAKALAKDKSQRYASAIDFALALQAAARSADPTIVPSANPYKSPRSGATIDERSGSTVNLRSGRGGGSLSTITQELELVYWKDVKDSDDLHDLEGFLRRFPDGVYSDLAKRRLKRIAGLGTIPGQAPYEKTEVVSRTALKAVQDPLEGSDDVTVPAIGAMLTGSTEPPETQPAGPQIDPDATFVRPPAIQLSAVPVDADQLPEAKVGPLPAPEADSLPDLPPAPEKALDGEPERDPKISQPEVITVEPEAKAKKPKNTHVESPAPRRAGLWFGLAGALLAAGAAWFWMGSSGTTAVAPAAGSGVATSPVANTASAVPPSDPANPGVAASGSTPAASIAPLPSTTASTPATAASVVALPAAGSASASSTASAASAPKVILKPLVPASGARAGREAGQRPLPAISSPRAPATELTTPVTPSTSPPTTTPARPGSAAVERPAPDQTSNDPREICKGKFMFAFGSCMSDQCALPRFQNHAACVEIRDQIERRRTIEQSR